VQCFIALEHQIYQLQVSEILQVSHKSLESFQQFSTRAKNSDSIGIVSICHVAGKGELQPTNVGTHAGHGCVVRSLLFGVPRNHVHEFVKIVEIQHGLEYERAEVFPDFVQAGGRSYVIQDVLPAAVVVKLSPCESGIFQGKRGPYVLQFEGAIP